MLLTLSWSSPRRPCRLRRLRRARLDVLFSVFLTRAWNLKIFEHMPDTRHATNGTACRHITTRNWLTFYLRNWPLPFSL